MGRTGAAAVEGGADAVRAAAAPPVPAAPISALTRGAFSWAARLRGGARVFHPRGVSFAGTAHPAPAAVGVLAGRDEVPATVRISRGIGLRHPLPDFNGVAVRLHDAHGRDRHQDLLLVSALRAPLARHVLVPVPLLNATAYNSILPYRTPDGLRLLGARALHASTLEEVGSELPVEITLEAAPLLGDWQPLASLLLERRVPGGEGESLRFDPWNSGPQLVPATYFNRLRLPAYAGSQESRPSRSVPG